MCKTLLCFSQNFLNEQFENDKSARVDMYRHPQGGYPIVVTHVIPETKLDQLRTNFPNISVFAEVEDGASPQYKSRTDARIYYRPVSEWHKRIGITADDLMADEHRKREECKRSPSVEALKLGERSRIPFQPRFAV